MKKTEREERRWFLGNTTMVFVWLLCVPIAVLLDWISSVAFVASISIYANAAGHLAAARADSNKLLQEVNRKLDCLLTREGIDVEG